MRHEPDEAPKAKEQHRRRIKRKGLRKPKALNHRAKKAKNKQKQHTYGIERKTLSKMEDGLRTVNIDSVNPDSMTEEQMQPGIIRNLIRRKIHISAIQKPRAVKDSAYLLDNYRFDTSPSTKKKKRE